MALDFFAGCVGGCAGVLAGHPLDTVKVKLQIQTDHRYRGTIHCITSIVKREGFRGLYKGMTSPLAGLAAINAIGFGVYGNTINRFQDKKAISSHFCAGALSGLCQTVIAAPMELTKLRVQVQQPNGAVAPFHTPLECFHHTYRHHGVPGLYRGFLLTVIRDCPAFGTYFASYEWLVRRLSVDGKPESLTVWQLLFAGGTAGTLSWLVNYPTDVLKTRFQADGIDAQNIAYRTIRECIVKTYREDGWRSFTHGLSSTLLRAFPTNAATFFAAEWTFRLYETYIERKPVGLTGGMTVEDHYREARPYAPHTQRRTPSSDEYASAALYLFPLTDAGSTMVDPLIHSARFY